MLCMQVRLVAMGTREFPIGILGRYCCVLRGSVDAVHRSATGNRGEDTTSALRSDHLTARWLLTPVGVHAVGGGHAVGSRPHGCLAVGMAVGSRGHGRIIGPAITRRRGSNGLRIRLSIGRGR